MIISRSIAMIMAGLEGLDAELAAMSAAKADVYTSAALPPLTSKRMFHGRCRRGEVPGATKSGRAWTCSRDAWHAARSRRPAPMLRLLEGPAPQSDRERAREMLAAAGFRRTR